MGFEEGLLAECARAHLPDVAQCGDIGFTPITTGRFNTSYFVSVPGAEYVLRIAPPDDSVFLFYERGMMKQEPAIHDVLLRNTKVPVARILAFDTAREVLPRDYLLMERLPGKALSDSAGVDTQKVLREVGAALAQVHAQTAVQYGYLGEHAPMPPQSTWQDAFAVMWRKLLDDIVGVGEYSAEERDYLLGLLDTHAGCFQHNPPAALLHMDVWSQNILADGAGRFSGLVDWDRALWGDPEIEFAVLDYCGVSQPAFWEGYGSQRNESPEAQVRHAFYLLYELQKYIVIRKGRNGDSMAARAYKRQAWQMISHVFG